MGREKGGVPEQAEEVDVDLLVGSALVEVDGERLTEAHELAVPGKHSQDRWVWIDAWRRRRLVEGSRSGQQAKPERREVPDLESCPGVMSWLNSSLFTILSM